MQTYRLYVLQICDAHPQNHDFLIDPQIPLLFCNHITNCECWQCGLFAGFLVQWTAGTNDRQSTEHPQPLPRWVTRLRLICLQLIVANVNSVDFHVLPNSLACQQQRVVLFRGGVDWFVIVTAFIAAGKNLLEKHMRIPAAVVVNIFIILAHKILNLCSRARFYQKP